jgi:hypothetical protein
MGRSWSPKYHRDDWLFETSDFPLTVVCLYSGQDGETCFWGSASREFVRESCSWWYLGLLRGDAGIASYPLNSPSPNRILMDAKADYSQILSPVDNWVLNGGPDKLMWCALNWKVGEVADCSNVVSLVTLRSHFACSRDGSVISGWRCSCLKSSRV